MDEDLNVSKLLRLKRYEKPPPGYFDDFLREFQRRQRVEALRRPGWAIFWERIVSIAPTFPGSPVCLCGDFHAGCGCIRPDRYSAALGNTRPGRWFPHLILTDRLQTGNDYRYASGLRTNRRVAAITLCASAQAREQ